MFTEFDVWLPTSTYSHVFDISNYIDDDQFFTTVKVFASPSGYRLYVLPTLHDTIVICELSEAVSCKVYSFSSPVLTVSGVDGDFLYFDVAGVSHMTPLRQNPQRQISYPSVRPEYIELRDGLIVDITEEALLKIFQDLFRQHHQALFASDPKSLLISIGFSISYSGSISGCKDMLDSLLQGKSHSSWGIEELFREALGLTETLPPWIGDVGSGFREVPRLVVSA